MSAAAGHGKLARLQKAQHLLVGLPGLDAWPDSQPQVALGFPLCLLSLVALRLLCQLPVHLRALSGYPLLPCPLPRQAQFSANASL